MLLLRLYLIHGGKAMEYFKKYRRVIVQAFILMGLLMFIDWSKEAFKALVAGGLIGSWIVSRLR